MEKCRIVRGGLETRLGRVRSGCCHRIDVDAETKLLDDLVPLPRLRQDAQSYMAQIGFLPGTEDAAQSRSEQGQIRSLGLTWRLPAGEKKLGRLLLSL